MCFEVPTLVAPGGVSNGTKSGSHGDDNDDDDDLGIMDIDDYDGKPGKIFSRKCEFTNLLNVSGTSMVD